MPLNLLVVDLDPAASCPAGVTPIRDSKGLLKERFDGKPGTFYLFRPDQHVTARWRQLDPNQIEIALARATGRR